MGTDGDAILEQYGGGDTRCECVEMTRILMSEGKYNARLIRVQAKNRSESFVNLFHIC